MKVLQKFNAYCLCTSDKIETPKKEQVHVVVEKCLCIEVEGVETYTLLCAPNDRKALVVGFLFSEGIIDTIEDITVLKDCSTDPDTVRVRLKQGGRRLAYTGRNLLIASSCGACGTEDFSQRISSMQKVKNCMSISSSLLRNVSEKVRKIQKIFEVCGGTHAAGIFDTKGEILSCAEDTGRHHALDKSIGNLLIKKTLANGCGVLLTGRVSLEMVGKCARAGIEIIAAVSAPTSLALEAAEKCNITLCAFVRQTRATVFTHPHRIIGFDKK